MLNRFLILIFFAVLPFTSCSAPKAQNASGPVVVFETTQGNIEIKLFPDIAPKACENLIGLIKKKFYDGLIFHRVVKDWVIQTGDPTATGAGGKSIWGKPFENEVNPFVKFDRKGLVGMANAGPDTNTSQFFITTVPAPRNDMQYTLFGEVIKGYDVVDKINKVPTDAQERPVDDQKIIRAYIKQE